MTTGPEITVLTRTRNPHRGRFDRVAEALAAQAFDAERWEWLVVDNASDEPLRLPDAAGAIRRVRVVREEEVGQTPAFLRGIAEARGGILVNIDDDNIPAPGYLAAALYLMQAEPDLGAVGGIVEAVLEVEPPDWLVDLGGWLALRNLGSDELRARWDADRPWYPKEGPIGAGMVVRLGVLEAWAREIAGSKVRGGLKRAGGGNCWEDVDIGLSALRAGWTVGYSPRLLLEHAIPRERLDPGYLAALARSTAFAQGLAMRELGLHAPPPHSRIAAWARMANAWRLSKPWQSPKARLGWAWARGSIAARQRHVLRAHGLLGE